MKKEAPYLSVVVAARNDNYGGDFETRLQNCINWFDYYANQYNLVSEFIIVNYNPVNDRPQLEDCITFNVTGKVQYKIITVPPSFHQQLETEPVRKALPFYEYVAKNIGIRRANGKYILSANPDILPDPSIIKHIAQKRLNPNTYYRTDRMDFQWPKGQPVQPNQLDRVREVSTEVYTKPIVIKFNHKPSFFKTVMKYKWQSKQWIWYYGFFRKFPRIREWYEETEMTAWMSHLIHVNASGDFILTYRNNWQKIQGHPEGTYLPVYTDALTVSMLRYSGLQERVFFYPVYHQNHERRYPNYDQDPEMLAMYHFFETESRLMYQHRKNKVYNKADWGFSNQQFAEKHL